MVLSGDSKHFGGAPIYNDTPSTASARYQSHPVAEQAEVELGETVGTNPAAADHIVVIPLGLGDSFEIDTPPKKKFQPMQCLCCLASPGRKNAKNLEQEMRSAKLLSSVLQDIMLGQIPEGVKVRCPQTPSSSTTSPSSYVVPAAVDRADCGVSRPKRVVLDAPWHRPGDLAAPHPDEDGGGLMGVLLRRRFGKLLHFYVVCVLVALCLTMAALCMVRDALAGLSRWIYRVTVFWLYPSVRAVVCAPYRILLLGYRVTAVCVLFALTLCSNHTAGVYRFALSIR